MDDSKPFLVIPDLQIPFENSNALQFCRYLKRHYQIPDENVLNVGDETDGYHGGSWPKDPNGVLTPTGEIAVTREKIKEWGSIFPKMKLAISNHGLRWMRKAAGAEIPSQVLRSYEDIFQMPEGWKWKDHWVIETKFPFRLDHGMDLGGKTPYRIAAELGTMSRVFGHLHSSAGIAYVHTQDKNIWAMNAGCLIDEDAYAFEYGKWGKFKPNLGAGVIADRGRIPIWIPLNDPTQP